MISGSELFFSYKRKEILRGVSVEIRKGEIVGLVGPNGVGKTTLIRILSGLLLPRKGDVKVETGVVSALIEQPAFFLDMTGRENIEYYLNRRITAEEIKAAPFGCKDFWEEPVRKYSMGMRQKLALWMIILSDSKILLLDEPSVSLDFDSVNELDECLKMQKKEKGILVSSHNFSELQNVCDRVLVMAEGKIIKELNVADKRRNVYAVQLYGRVDSKVYEMLKSEGIDTDDNVLYMSGTEEEVAGMVRRLVLAGADICEVSKCQSRLEEQYHELLRHDKEAIDEERDS